MFPKVVGRLVRTRLIEDSLTLLFGVVVGATAGFMENYSFCSGASRFGIGVAKISRLGASPGFL